MLFDLLQPIADFQMVTVVTWLLLLRDISKKRTDSLHNCGKTLVYTLLMLKAGFQRILNLNENPLKVKGFP